MQGGYFKTKRVHIFVNGHAQSKTFYIHPRCRLGWNAILDCFSRKLNPKFGAIRVLRTIDGRKIIETFYDLQHEGKYVACGLEAFRSIKGGYLTNTEISSRTKICSEYYPTEALSPDEKKKYPCLIETMRKGRTIIFVFANGKRSDPKKVVLIKSDYEAWDSILRHIGHILDIPEGVKGMFTVFGQPLCSPYEIQHGGYYVAIPFSATFKAIKYLISQKSSSYHESSPMVTKDAYICAAKTCKAVDGYARKRRRSRSTKVKDNSEDTGPDENQEKLEHRVRIEGKAIRRKEAKRRREMSESDKNFLKKRVTGYPGNLYFGTFIETETPETSYDHRVTVDSLYEGSDKDADNGFQENEVHITNYFQKEEFTQTSSIFLQATYEDNALFLNRKKYYLVPETELQKFGDVDKSDWFTRLLKDPSKESAAEYDEDDVDEVKLIAGAMIGLIIKVSEKIANRSVFGKTESEASDLGAKLSLIPDTLQPSSTSRDLNQAVSKTSQKTRERNTSIVSKDKSLRLSIPIGRIMAENNQDSPKKSLTSKLDDSSRSLRTLDKEFKPLTPHHTLTNPEDLVYLKNVEDDEDDPSRTQSKLLRHLKKDSVGFPETLHQLKELVKTLSNASRDPERNISNEANDDEWKKLDILEDLGIMAEDEIGSDEDLELLLDEQEAFEDEGDEILSDEGETDFAESSLHEAEGEEYDYDSREETEEDGARVDDSDSDSCSDDDDQEVPYCQRYLSYLKSQAEGESRKVEKVEEDLPYEDEIELVPAIENGSGKSSEENGEIKVDNSLTAYRSKEFSQENVEGDKRNEKSEPDKDEIAALLRYIEPAEEEILGKKSQPQEIDISQPRVFVANLEASRLRKESPIDVAEFQHSSSEQSPLEVGELKHSSREESPLDVGELRHSLREESPLDVEKYYYTKPQSFFGSMEDRRITVNTWDHPVEKVLKDKFEEEASKIFGDQPEQQSAIQEDKVEGLEMPTEQPIDEATSKIIGDRPEQQTAIQEDKVEGLEMSTEQSLEEERRALMNFLRMKIEIALSGGQKLEQEDSH